MDRSDALWDILKKEYGIHTMEELNEAIRRQPRIDISVFCSTKEDKGVKK